MMGGQYTGSSRSSIFDFVVDAGGRGVEGEKKLTLMLKRDRDRDDLPAIHHDELVGDGGDGEKSGEEEEI